MKKSAKILALALGSMFVLTAIAACGDSDDGGEGAALTARICYDNLPNDNITLSAEDTSINVGKVTDIKSLSTDNYGKPVDVDKIATYKDGVFTAVGAGTLTFKADGKLGRLEVVPAYVTNPGNQYSNLNADLDLNNSSLLGNTHDPSFIETVDEYGYPVYYLFSTGWSGGNDIHKSYDLLNWTYEGKTTHGSDAKQLPADLANWSNANNVSQISWWAPDIVPAYGGGYWLYTCTTQETDRMRSMSSADFDGAATEYGRKYSQAAIVLYWTDSLDKDWKTESFEYKGVLMQSCIPQDATRGENLGAIDINSIDPQIIYSPDGKMYMAYGSFGTGNWLLELNPETGLRKDDVYSDNAFKTPGYVRKERNKIVSDDENVWDKNGYAHQTKFLAGQEVKSDYYGKLITLGAMEAPVLARHDNVTVSDENGTVLAENKTYYYSMHSYNWLESNYQMWGGRSESVWGTYQAVSGGLVYNVDAGSSNNQGNKYMGAFKWRDESKSTGNKEINIALPGHNDLYTTNDGTSLAAYITRTWDNGREGFCVQLHQYYLNSYGDICINPNRYSGEIDRTVTEEELLKYTDNGRFEMVVLANTVDVPVSNPGATNSSLGTYNNISFEVVLGTDHSIKKGGTQIGTWKMYGKGYIKFEFTETLKGTTNSIDSGEKVYYGVVRPAWLGNRNQSGFTITMMGHTPDKKTNMALFLNNYSTIEGTDLIG